jgi:hypothetical protein
MITTVFRCALERFTVSKPSITAWQPCNVRLAWVQLLVSCDQLVGVW